MLRLSRGIKHYIYLSLTCWLIRVGSVYLNSSGWVFPACSSASSQLFQLFQLLVGKGRAGPLTALPPACARTVVGSCFADLFLSWWYRISFIYYYCELVSAVSLSEPSIVLLLNWLLKLVRFVLIIYICTSFHDVIFSLVLECSGTQCFLLIDSFSVVCVVVPLWGFSHIHSLRPIYGQMYLQRTQTHLIVFV